MKRLIVLLGVAGVSLSAVLVRWSTAPSLTLVFYRMGFTAALMAPYVLLRRREELRGLTRREALLCLASGAFLGLHFAAYFESLRWTSIAASVVLVDTEALFVALATVLVFRKRLTGRAWLAIALTFAGSAAAALAGGGGGAAPPRGNLLALSGALFMAVYTLIGAVCRRRLTTAVYTFLVYLAAAGTVAVIALLSGTPLTGCGGVNYLTALAMAVLCTLLGHSLFSWGLKYLPAAFIATVKLLEPVFASVWGLLVFREVPGLPVILGGAAVILGVFLYSRETEGV